MERVHEQACDHLILCIWLVTGLVATVTVSVILALISP